MSTLGSLSFGQRMGSQVLVWKMLARKIAATTRCALPGVIKAFNSATQYCSVQLTIGENVSQPDGSTKLTLIPQLDDVLLMLPGGASWCLTFPNVVGCECLVAFADMCINTWATGGMQQDSNGKPVACGQEIVRRHDLSDGFAILAPRSKPNAIPNYSTTDVELRSMDNSTKIALGMTDGIILKGSQLQLQTGNPVPGTTTSTQALPVKINGILYYIRLSTAP